MNMIAVDDERRVLRDIELKIKDAVPHAALDCFTVAKDALAYAGNTKVDVAFLDIEMPSMTGLTLALKLKETNPKTNIIFVTAYSDYVGNALSMHVSGYLLKPITKDAILRELENLRHPVAQNAATKRVCIKCFGSFEVFIDGTPHVFNRSKVKELLAYLIDRRGEGATAAEIGSALWEGQEYTRSVQKQVQSIISLLMKAMREKNIEYIIIKRRNYIAINVEKVNCDYFDFLRGDATALNNFFGEYMSNYNWAEITAAQLYYLQLQKQ